MPWQDRVLEAAYTSPSGVRQTFAYEDVKLEFDKKTSSFDFPDADGTYVQDNGPTSRRFPLRMFFWGDDYDEQADAFLELLREVGTGQLDHPKYGTPAVVPFGTINRRDDLKTAANQAVIELTFWETTDIIYPQAQGDPASEVLAAVDAFNDTAADELADSLDLATASERVSFRNIVDTLVDNVQGGLQLIADTEAAVRQQFDAIVTSIQTGITELVSTPLTLAFQVVQLVQAPARAFTAIAARLTAYKDLATAIFGGDGASVASGSPKQVANTFHAKDLFVSAYVTGAVISAVNTQFVTKPQALAAAEEILDQFAAVTAWRDEQFAELAALAETLPLASSGRPSEVATTDTGGAYQQLQDAVALAAGFLVQISFTLQREHRVTLDRARTPIDLAMELYGTVDDKLDFLISSNDLSGSEILELPRGRTIVYYL